MKALQLQSFDLSIDEHGEKNICNIYPIISAGTIVAGMPWSILNSDQEKAYQLHDHVSGEELNKYTFIHTIHAWESMSFLAQMVLYYILTSRE